MNKDEIMFSKKQLLGEFAKWAVKQSPYCIPENLDFVLWKLSSLLPTSEYVDLGFKTMEKSDFHKWFYNIITQIPEVVNWNKRKNGNKAPFGFVSIFDKPNPDDDFIDLDALVMNVERGLTDESNQYVEKATTQPISTGITTNVVLRDGTVLWFTNGLLVKKIM